MSVGSSGILGIVDVVKTKTEAVVLEFQDLSAQVQLLDASFVEFNVEFQDLSAQVNAGDGGVGEVITATMLGQSFTTLNVEQVVQGADKQDWSLTLSAGTYMFVFAPKAYIVAADGSNPIWSNTNCNCSFITYKLGDNELSFSVFDNLSVPVGTGESVKNFGNQTMIFTLATETTLGLTAKMSSPEIGTPAIDPTLSYAWTQSTINYVKLA